ncbi:MAG: GAF domain-containing sensor histidine kinase [Anaerolineae bacterium]|nr:GAF domain-containing sensor histidine kinase [Anaerolineae bacterium]
MLNVPDNSGNDPPVQHYLHLIARYERLMEISRQLTSTLDITALLERIILASTELTDSEEASILLVDPQTDELRFAAATDISVGARDALVVPKEGSIAGWVVTHGEFVLVPDARHEPRWFKGVQDTVGVKTHNLLAVPMRSHTRVIGALEAVNKRNDAPYTEEDINTLTTLAAQAAVAIENARLFQQSDFISELVHELRTPLAAIKASTALLLRPNLPDDRRHDILLTMDSETDRLSKMTTEFLDLARLESGRTRLEMGQFELGDLINESVTVIRHQASERNLGLHLGGEERYVRGDRGKIKQVLLNLLTNAIKYNVEGGQIFVTHQKEPDAPRFVRVTVRDTGKGIAAENQQHIFERFYRAADEEGYTQGTGLGLVIAKRIVEAHGGTMWLESQFGVGTTFFFTLPDAQAPAGRTAITTTL